MKTSKKLFTILIFTLSIFGIASLSPVPSTYADGEVLDICSSNAPAEVKKANGCPGSGEVAKLDDVIINIINAVIAVLGTVAVVFIVIGGVNYMTSAGDAAKVQKAKSTILYASIGLVICALAFAIANFVINIVNNAQ